MSQTGVEQPVSQPLIPPFLPRMIHRLALPIVLVWLALVFITNTMAPQLEVVAKNHAVSQSPKDAPSFQSMMRVGRTFNEFNSDSSAMVVLEGQQTLGPDAHHYYDEIVRRLKQDTTHVQHIQDFWSDPLTAAGSQSTDGKAAYVQVYLAGNMGGSLSTESTEAVRKIVNSVPAPPGIKAYVTGAGPLIADQSHAGEKGVKKVTMVTILVIIVMLLIVYRSVSTVMIMMFMVFVELAAARGVGRQEMTCVVVRLVAGQGEQADQCDRDRHRENRCGPADDGGADASPALGLQLSLRVEQLEERSHGQDRWS